MKGKIVNDDETRPRLRNFLVNFQERIAGDFRDNEWRPRYLLSRASLRSDAPASREKASSSLFIPPGRLILHLTTNGKALKQRERRFIVRGRSRG